MTFDERLQEAKQMYKSQHADGQGVFPLGILLGVLDKGLELWNSKEKTKYIDRKIALLKERKDEENKIPRSRMALDAIDDELNILCIAFTSEPISGTGA